MEELKYELYTNYTNELIGKFNEKDLLDFIAAEASKENLGIYRMWEDDRGLKKYYDCGNQVYYSVPYPEYGKSEPTEYELKYCLTNHHVKYKGFDIPMYMDDYGQQYYCYFNNECYNFGAYNLCYEDDVEYIIDKYLDKEKQK